MTTKKYTVAFLGTGIMGLPMAANLCQAGVNVKVWNRSPDKAKSLVEHGATICNTPQEAVTDVDMVISILSDYKATANVFVEQDVAAAMPNACVLVNMATLTLAETLDLSAEIAAKGLGYMDVPVSGGEKGAIQASLSIMAGGTQSDFDVVSPVLSFIGRPTYMGDIGSGAIAKICGQLIVGNTIAVVSESINFAQQMGLDAAALHQALSGSFADSVIFQEHGKRMIEENFEPGGPAKYIIPILKIAETMAAEQGVFMPLLSKTRALFEDLEAGGGGDLDLSHLFMQIKGKNKT